MRWILCFAAVAACAGCERHEPGQEQRAQSVQQSGQAAAGEAQPMGTGPYAPRDECLQAAGATEFRSRIADAVRQRDSDALAALTADDIKLDFGGGAGVEELGRRMVDSNRHLWDELEAILPLGCAVTPKGEIIIPWVAGQDIATADPGAAMLVMGMGVPVLSAADPSASSVGSVSWDVVEVPAFVPELKFQQVTLPDGTRGFVATDALRSLLDYRLAAANKGGGWRIESLLAGD